MKKALIFILLAALTLTGCGASTLEISQTALDYLATIGVTESRMASMNARKIEGFHRERGPRDLAYITANIDEMLNVYFDIEPSEDGIARQGRLVSFAMTVCDASGKTLAEYEKASVCIGCSLYGGLEEALSGKAIGDTAEFAVDEALAEVLNVPSGSKARAEIKGVFDQTMFEETRPDLERDGLADFMTFYKYLFDIKADEFDFETDMKFRSEFMQNAISACRFKIDDGDLKNHGEQVMDEYMQAAESFQMSVEDYCATFLNMEGGDFFVMCAKTAEKEIQQALVIGALAEKYGIEYTEEQVEDYIAETDGETIDDVALAYIRYYCLENAVFERFLP